MHGGDGFGDLVVLKNVNIRKKMSKLKNSITHYVTIEDQQLPINERICCICHEIEDEFHNVIKYHKFNEARETFN